MDFRFRYSILLAATGLLAAWTLPGPALAEIITHITGGNGQVWVDFLHERAQKFEAQTGAKVNIIALSGGDARAKYLTIQVVDDSTPDRFGIDSISGYTWMQFVHQAGGALYDALFPTTSAFASKPVLTATTYAKSLVDRNVVGGIFATQTAAISMSSSAQIRTTLDQDGIDWDMALHAQGPYSRASMFGVGGLQISSQSRHSQLAWQWIKFLALDPDSVREYVRTNLRIPPLRSVQPEYADLTPDLKGHNWRALIDAVGQPGSFALPVVTTNTQAVDNAVSSTTDQIWQGRIAPEAALEQLQAQVNGLLKG